MKIDKKYTVKVFCDNYKDEKKRDSLLSDVIKNHYVPFEQKIAICQKVVELSHYVKEEINGKEYKRPRINSSTQYVLFNLYMVNEYTNIDVQFKNVIEEFNLLNGCGALDGIIVRIDDRESKEFRMVLDMTESDLLQNEYEIHAYVNNLIDRVENIVDTVGTPALDMIQHLAKNTDWKNVFGVLKSLKDN